MQKLILILVICFSYNGYSAVSFNELYEKSLINNELVQTKKAELNTAKINKSMAWSSLAPSISANYVHTKQQIPDSVKASSLSIRENQITSALNVKQPLFQGGGEYYGLEAASVDINRAQSELEEQKRQIYIQLTELFYNYLALVSDNKNNQKLINSVARRVKELSQRARVGRSNPADLLSAQAQLSQLKANLNLSQAQAENLKHSLYEITGEEITDKLIDNISAPKNLPVLETWLEKLQQRSDIATQKQLLKISELRKNITQTQHMPKLSVDGIYYFERTGNFFDSDWSVSLNVSLPIFEGGQTYFESKKNSQQILIQKLSLTNLLRRSEIQLKNQFKLTKALFEQVKQYQATLEISQKAYNQQMRDYRSGLISYLEASQAERDYYEILKTADRQEYELKKQWLKLKAQAGDLK